MLPSSVGGQVECQDSVGAHDGRDAGGWQRQAIDGHSPAFAISELVTVLYLSDLARDRSIGGMAEVDPPALHRIGADVIEHNRFVAVGPQQIGEQHRAVLLDDRRIALDRTWPKHAARQIGRCAAAVLRNKAGDAPQDEREHTEESDSTQYGHHCAGEWSTQLWSSHDHSVPVNSDWSQPARWSYGSEFVKRPYRVVVAKPGLDGHDRGAKTITRALRDHGFEVIYTGLHQTPEQIAETTLQEDADAVGLSLLSGAHLTLFPRVMHELRERGLDEVLVFGGGVIPDADARALRSQGVAEIFGPGSSLKGISAWLEAALDNKEN